ncbi:Uncharacterised protein [Mycobacteroides abscessus]|nr:Uncharacterised protein [Mycobacteroides abscessus]
MPTAADSHIAAAVVNPCTAPRRMMMIPAPRKPIPETICAATRDGSRITMPSASTSSNPYLLTNKISAAEVPTIVCVRNPALLPAISRSRPIIPDSTNAASSPTSCRPP